MISNFAGNLSCPVEVGHVFMIAGTVTDDAQRFDVNIACGKFEESGIALHISVRFHESMIVRNACIPEIGWSNEEREENLIDPDTPMPILPGDKFKIYILVAEGKFQVSINGRPYCDFAYRMDIDQIRTISVTKDVAAITNIDHRQVYPYPHPIIQCNEPKYEFSNDVPKLFEPGHVIIMQAIPYGNPQGTFTIRFNEGDNPKKNALFFNVRFHRGVVALNHTTDNGSYGIQKWLLIILWTNCGFLFLLLYFRFGYEVINGDSPFVIDQQFKLAIGITETSFKFGVNGEFFTEFFFRSPNVRERMNGFTVAGGNGMKLDIRSVDHMNMGIMDCEGFESYSDPNVELN